MVVEIDEPSERIYEEEELLDPPAEYLDRCEPGFVDASRDLAYTLEANEDWAGASKIYTRLLPAQRRTRGEEDPHCMRTVFGLAKCFEKDGNYEEAEALLEPLLVTRELVLGAEHPHTVNVRELLASCYSSTGRLDEANTMLETALQLQRRQPEPRPGDEYRIITCLCDVGARYAKRGDFDAAQETLSEHIIDLRKLVEPDDNELLLLLTYLADGLAKLGNDKQAEKVLKEILDKRVRSYGGWGTEHKDTVAAMVQAGNFYLDRNRHEKARTLWDKITLVREQELGVNHPLTQGAQWYLAKALLVANDSEQARRVTELGVEGAARRLKHADGEDYHEIMTQLFSFKSLLGICYAENGRFKDAKDLLEEVLSAIERSDGLDLQATLLIRSQCHHWLGYLCKENGNLEGSKDHRVRGVNLCEQLPSPNQEQLILCVNGLAYTLFDMDRAEEVEKLTRDLVKSPEATRGVPPGLVADLVLCLAHSFYDRDRYAEAKPLYERAIPIREKLFGPHKMNVLGPLSKQAFCEWEIKQYPEAERHFKRATAGLEALRGLGDEATTFCMGCLLNVLYAQGKSAEAEALRTDWATKGGPSFVAVSHGRKGQSMSEQERRRTENPPKKRKLNI
ncbi:MAG: hypothetical protein Q9208_003726 [Pyrenodesmia sp. 3 TL-2023]